MKDKQVGIAYSFQLAMKNEALMDNHRADHCQMMGDYQREVTLRYQAKKKMNIYWALETQRIQRLQRLQECFEALENPQPKPIQLSLF